MLIYNENHTHWCTRADEAAGKWQSGGWMTRGRAKIAGSKENWKEGDSIRVLPAAQLTQGQDSSKVSLSGVNY